MSSNGTLDYSPEVLCLMYVNGDRDDPNRKTAKCIEEIIRKQSSNVIRYYSNIKVGFFLTDKTSATGFSELGLGIDKRVFAFVSRKIIDFSRK